MWILVICLTACLSTARAAVDIREPPGVMKPDPSSIPMLYFKTDASFTLPCAASGTPRPDYTWYLDGKVLDLNNIRIDKGRDGQITINNAMLFDEGDYQCVAANQWGKSLSQIFSLKRAKIGDFPADKKITEFYGKEGDSLKVERIAINSVPTPSFSWKKVEDVDDKFPKQVVRSRRILQDIDGNLYFTYLSPTDALDDSHFYKVDVFNNVLDQTTGGSYSKVIVEKSTSGGLQPLKLLYPETSPAAVTVLEGEELKVQCIFGGHAEIAVTWAGPAENHLLEEYGTLLKVEKVSQSHEGRYTCTGAVPPSPSDRRSLVGHIDVDVQTPPKFTPEGRPGRQTLSEGDTVTFVCQTTDDTEPEATVNWMINTVLIDERVPGPRTEVTTIHNGKKLTIVDLKRQDIKVIQCKIANVHRTLYADAPLNVLLRTTLTSFPGDQVLQPNTSVLTLNCTATSDPSTPVQLKWTRDGKFIAYYDDSNMVEENGLLQLNLAGLGAEQIAEYSGIYTCNGSNGYSFETHNVKLTYSSGNGTTGGLVSEASSLWLIILIIVLLLLLLIIFLICCICLQRNKGDSYPVDEKERANGNDPLTELDHAGFHDYQRPPVARRKDSRASLTSTAMMGSQSSLDAFGDFSEGGMSEDGSFIGHYVSDQQRRKLNLSSSEA